MVGRVHVDDLHNGKLLQDTARRQSGCQRTQPPRESDVPAIGQERDEDVRLDAGLELVKDRNSQATSIVLGWFNTEMKPAIGGRAFVIHCQQRYHQWKRIGEAPITGGFPGNGATAKFSINMHRSLELFLVCANYADDNNAIYRQAYVYRLGAPTGDPNEIPLIEELQARGLSAEVCNSSNCPGLVRSASQSRPIEE